MTKITDRTIWSGDNPDILRGLDSASAGLICLDHSFNPDQNYVGLACGAVAGAAFQHT